MEEEEAAVSSAEENMALARRFLEARIQGDQDAVDEMMTPDFVSHTTQIPGQAPDRGGQIWATAQFSAAVSNASVHFEDQIVQGDKVVTRCVEHATHDRGELMGVAPSGGELTYMPIAIHRIEGSKIAEQWGGGTGLSELRGLRLEQEERERVEQELLQWRGASSKPRSQGGAYSRGMADLPALPASPRSGRRLLRLPPSL